ncbi:MAG: carboxypeptidase regulatory-like domain-containing protein [Pyrinomonadaceae bacterium]
MRSTRQSAATVCFLITAFVCAVGQSNGSLEGVVARDTSGTKVAGVTIVFTNQVTSEIRRVATDANGMYSIQLPPGAYRVTVEPPYRAKFEKEKNYGQFALPRDEALENLIIETGKRASLDLVVEKQKPEPTAALPVETSPGYARDTTVPSGLQTTPERREARDRWRLGFPEYDRYGDRGGRGRDIPFTKGRWWDPYNQSVLKGDYPIRGNNLFMVLSATSTTTVEQRRAPTPSDVSSDEPGSAEFFGQPEQLAATQTLQFSFELFRGDTVFKPRDWAIKISPTFSIPNYLNARENGVVNIDVRRGTNRTDTHVSLEEAFAEVKLADLSANYDFISLRAGIQPFVSDFRGFIFSDNNLGARLFGSFDNNRFQFNAAYFSMLEKDTNSGLNTFDTRHQNVYIANLFRQDFISKVHNSGQPALQRRPEQYRVRPEWLSGEARFGRRRSPSCRQGRLRGREWRWTPGPAQPDKLILLCVWTRRSKPDRRAASKYPISYGCGRGIGRQRLSAVSRIDVLGARRCKPYR